MTGPNDMARPTSKPAARPRGQPAARLTGRRKWIRPSGLRRRLLIAFVLVAAISAGALAVASFLLPFLAWWEKGAGG